MLILLDTNIYVSAALYPESLPARIIPIVVKKYQLAICTAIKEELIGVMGRKAPHLVGATSVFLSALPCRLIPCAPFCGVALPDPKDQPILDAAVYGNVDILISGDKHFLNFIIDRPLIMTVSDFMVEYGGKMGK